MYTYNDMPDKTEDGIKKEISGGLAIMAFYWKTTFGFPEECFGDLLKEKCKNFLQLTLLYFKFRNEHPELY